MRPICPKCKIELYRSGEMEPFPEWFCRVCLLDFWSQDGDLFKVLDKPPIPFRVGASEKDRPSAEEILGKRKMWWKRA